MYLVWRDRDQVRRELERVVNLENLTNEWYFSWLATVYNRMGAFERAKEAGHHVTAPIPKLLIESMALMQRQEWDKALAINTKLIKKLDARKQTLFGYFSAICYYEKGEFDRAISPNRPGRNLQTHTPSDPTACVPCPGTTYGRSHTHWGRTAPPSAHFWRSLPG